MIVKDHSTSRMHSKLQFMIVMSNKIQISMDIVGRAPDNLL